MPCYDFTTDAVTVKTQCFNSNYAAYKLLRFHACLCVLGRVHVFPRLTPRTRTDASFSFKKFKVSTSGRRSPWMYYGDFQLELASEIDIEDATVILLNM